MSDTKSESPKASRARHPTGPAPRPRRMMLAPAAEDDGFAAGIVDEPVAKPRASRRHPSRHNVPKARRLDPNEHGFDAETNSRYEEIKRGNTYITELQQMTMAQLQKSAKDEERSRARSTSASRSRT